MVPPSLITLKHNIQYASQEHTHAQEHELPSLIPRNTLQVRDNNE